MDNLSLIEADVDELDRLITQILAGIRYRRVLAEDCISQIDTVLYRQVLEQYYCTAVETYEELGKTHIPYRRLVLLSLNDVAVNLNRNYNCIRRAHTEALEAFKRVYRATVDTR